jgi:hypothetical protein
MQREESQNRRIIEEKRLDMEMECSMGINNFMTEMMHAVRDMIANSTRVVNGHAD